MSAAAGDRSAPPLVDPELILLDQLAAEQQRQQSTSATRDEPPPMLVGTNEPATTGPSYQSRPKTVGPAVSAAATAPDSFDAIPSGSGTPPASTSHAGSSRKRKGPIRDTYICTLCSPPVEFPTSAKKAGHTQVVHQARVRVTSDAGLYFYVGRDDADRAFSCPRLGCSHRTPNTVSFGLHVRHTCRQPWPTSAPDPPEADLPRDELEEAEGNKRKRGGGRGKGKRRKGLAESANVLDDGHGPDSGPQAIVNRIRTSLDSVLTQAGVGEEPQKLHDLLRRLETHRQALSVRADEALGLGKDRQTTEVLEQAKQALQSDLEGTSTRDFARWHIYTLLSPPFATEDAPARPDLNIIAHLVLHYLPFSTPAADNASIALRSTLLTAIGHAERGQAVPAPGTPGLPTIDQLRAKLLHHADVVASADQSLASYMPSPPAAALAQGATPSLSPASPAGEELPTNPGRATRPTMAATAAATVPRQQRPVERAQMTSGSFPSSIEGRPPPTPQHPPTCTPSPSTFDDHALDPFPSLAHRPIQSLHHPPYHPGQAGPSTQHPLVQEPAGASSLQPQSLPPTVSFPTLVASYTNGGGSVGSIGSVGQTSVPLQPSLLSHPPLTAASIEAAALAPDPADNANDRRAVVPAAPASRPLPPGPTGSTPATGLVGGGGGRSSRRQLERERIAQLYLLAEELASAPSP